MTRIFIGTAWPYSNGPFHIGHLAGAYLPGDIFARFHRLRGHEVLFVSGSDMHGTPILLRSEREHVAPEALARSFHAVNRAAFERLGFTFDRYSHTHTVVHEATVQALFLALLENGYIARRTEPSAYCPAEATFRPDRYIVGTCPECGFESARGDECDRCGRVLDPTELRSPRCQLCGGPIEFRPSEHFYLELDRLAEPLGRWVGEQRHWRAGTRRVAEQFLADGLHPTPITRDLTWGVPLPLDGYPTKRFYVWFDALVGYLSASKEWAIAAGAPEAWRKFWDADSGTRQYYFVGKDNKFHHTVLWPAMLLGARGFALPYDVPANEWLRVDGDKISKSRTGGDALFIPSLLERYAPDRIRFYAALYAPQHHDIEFDWDEFEQAHDEVLSNQWGNLVQRVLVLVREREGGKIPAPGDPSADPASRPIAARLRAAHERITAEYEAVHLKEALELALAEVREANRWFHEAKPWQADARRRAEVLFDAVWTVRALAIWLSPVLPFSSAEVFRALGEPAPGPNDWETAVQPPRVGQPIGELRPLFPKAGTPRAAERAGDAPLPSPPTATVPPPLDLRVGVVVAAEPHPDADKLLALRVDLGEGAPRSIVAGLKGHYDPVALVGRRVVVLANLAPRTIRKVRSEGMLLAADIDGRPELLEVPSDARAGESLSGFGPAARTIRYEEFIEAPLWVGEVEGDDPSDRSRVRVGNGSVVVGGRWPPGSRVVVRPDGVKELTGRVLYLADGRPVTVARSVPAGTRVR